MPKTDKFADTFAALRTVLEPHAKKMAVAVDKPGHYELASKTMVDRIGRPLFFACVKTGKAYVSYHLIPLYLNPALQKSVPASLQKRKQGMACFNFTTTDAAQLKELSALTKKGLAAFKNLKLPWA